MLAWVPHDLHVEDHAEEYPTPGFGLKIWDVGFALTLSIKIAQKPYIIGSLGPKALNYESFEGKGKGSEVSGFAEALELTVWDADV